MRKQKIIYDFDTLYKINTLKEEIKVLEEKYHHYYEIDDYDNMYWLNHYIVIKNRELNSLEQCYIIK